MIQEGWDSCVVTIIDDDEPDVSELEAAVAELEQQMREMETTDEAELALMAGIRYRY